MSDPASITLSPCPFCGGEGRTSKFTAAVVRQPWRALCMNDDCPMELHCDFTTEADAIAAWNTRAALAQPARAQAGVAELVAHFRKTAKTFRTYADVIDNRVWIAKADTWDAAADALAALGGEDG